MNAIQFPLTRVAIGLTLGILYARFCPSLPLHSLALLGALLLLFICLHLVVKKWPKLQYFLGLTVFFTSVGCGIATYTLHRESNYPNHFSHLISARPIHQVDLVLSEKLKTTAKNYRFVAQVKRIDQKNCFGKVIILCKKTDFVNKTIGIGSRLSINGQLYTPQPQMNPGSFDYWEYLQLKNIYGQIFASGTNTVLLPQPEIDLFYWADQIRLRAMNNLQKSGIDPQVAQVLAALTVGQQQEISSEIMQDYQSAGVVHILSVSGLHVGFIVLFLGFILKFLPKNQKTRWLKLMVVLLSLWGFALLAGLSASVVRSVTMYSFVAVALHLKRRTNIFHTLLVSLLLILLIAPTLLFDVGLQLSYTALFFILWLQPVFEQWLNPENKIARYFWQITTVSLAAQIGTLPLSLYYFHQFPGLFLLANLVVIPMIGLIMAVGVPMMIFAALGWVPKAGLELISALIQGLNAFIKTIAQADEYVFRNIPFNFWMLWASYLTIICCVWALKKPIYQRVRWALISIFIFQLAYGVNLYIAEHKREWLVLHQKKATIVVDRYGSKILVYHHGEIAKATLENYQTSSFIQKIEYRKLQRQARYKNCKILILDGFCNYYIKEKPDILLLCSRPKVNLERVLLNWKPKTVVADGNNYPSSILRWEETCHQQKIPFHYTGKKGFFKISD
ncbi:MAG: ComEC/Rec2 family competence protein [Flavobacteriaceae bacterium]